MATLQVTARKSQQALRGEGVRVFVNSTEQGTKLPFIVAGDKVGIVSTGYIGHVVSVDYFGNSFLCEPNTMDSTLESTSTPGYLNNGELVNIN